MVSGAIRARLDLKSKIVLWARQCGPQRRAEPAATLVEAQCHRLPYTSLSQVLSTLILLAQPCFVLCADKNRPCLPRVNRCRELMGMTLAPDDLQLERLPASWGGLSRRRDIYSTRVVQEKRFPGQRIGDSSSKMRSK
jgi:hypothetical protein